MAHWAYEQGKQAAREGRQAERGLMAFGLACAGDAETERNTRQWLQGFDDEMKTQAERVDEWFGDPPWRGPRRRELYGR